MKAFLTRRKSLLVAASAALALSPERLRRQLRSTANPPVAEKPSFAADTTMAKLSSAGKITIGTKFDQPLFGQKGLDGKPVGFDVEIGKLIAAKLGIPADKIEWVGDCLRQPRAVHQAGQGGHRSSPPTPSTTSARPKSTSPDRTTRPARP